MEIHKADINDSVQFDEFVERSGGSILQSWFWGEFKSRFGWTADRYFFIKDGDIAGSASVLSKRLPLGSLAYLPQGPSINFADEMIVEEVFGSIKKLCAKNIFLRIDPPVLETSEEAVSLKKILARVGFKKSAEEIQPRDTLVLDLSKTETELLGDMHQKGRYNIRLATKKNVRVEESWSPEHIDGFAKLYLQTTSRDEFSGHNDSYIRSLLSTFETNKRGRLFTAWKDSEMLAGIFVIFFGGTAIYLYGASSNESRELMPNHALQWHAIRYAKAKGYKEYDFWGVSPEDEPNHNWAGVTRFKKQFGGEVRRYIGAYDLPIQKSKYFAFTKAQKIRRKLMRFNK